MQITLTLSDGLSPAIARAIAAANDFSPVMADITDQMESDSRFRFRDGVDPDDVPWLPSQRVREHGGQTLVLSRDLVDSITSESDALSATVGTNLIYAAIHQFGGVIRGKLGEDGKRRALNTPFGPRHSVTMPARPFLGFGDDDGPRFEAMLSAHLRNAFEGEQP